MEAIEPINIPFFGTITHVNPVIERYELAGDIPPVVKLELMDENGQVLQSVEQPVSAEAYKQLESQLSAIKRAVISWAYAQQNIVKLGEGGSGTTSE